MLKIDICGHECLFTDESNVGYADRHGIKRGPILDEIRDGKWESELFSFISRSAGDLSHFVDLGAWIGVFSIFARKLGFQVCAVEPDPAACRMLLANATLNFGADSGFQVISAAVSPNPAALTTLHLVGLGDSETSVHQSTTRGGGVRHALGQFQCGSLSLAQACDKAPAGKLLLKMDIEGAEYLLADQITTVIAEKAPRLALSLHPENLTATMSDAELGRQTLRLLRSLSGRDWYVWVTAQGRAEGGHKDLMAAAESNPAGIRGVYCG